MADDESPAQNQPFPKFEFVEVEEGDAEPYQVIRVRMREDWYATLTGEQRELVMRIADGLNAMGKHPCVELLFDDVDGEQRP